MKFLAVLPAVLLFSTFTQTMSGQSVLQCLSDGAWHQVEEMRGKTPYYADGYGMSRANAENVALTSVDAFGPGFVNVEVVENKRQGVVDEDGLLKFIAPRSWYRLKATLVADVDLENCYYVLKMDDYGDSAYVCKSLGTLKEGEPRVVEIMIRVRYEMPQQLHIFSEGREVRTTLVPRSYTYNYGSFMFATN